MPQEGDEPWPGNQLPMTESRLVPHRHTPGHLATRSRFGPFSRVQPFDWQWRLRGDSL